MESFLLTIYKYVLTLYWMIRIFQKILKNSPNFEFSKEMFDENAIQKSAENGKYMSILAVFSFESWKKADKVTLLP